MTNQLTQQQADAIVSADPDLNDAVGDAFFECDTQEEFQDICTLCAATLYERGWDQVPTSCKDMGGLLTIDDVAQKRARLAIKELRRVGVLPQGWLAWMFAAALRQAAWAFVGAMIRRWLENNDATRS